jgi:ferrous iron transport protein B
MHDHFDKKTTITSGARKIFLVGNPNVGKSAIFGLLTGKYVTVSNYPGTTVEVTRGETTIHREKFIVVDTPGVNSLIPMSEDEKVTRDILLEEKPQTVIQVMDSKNIKRSLFITMQLVEMGVPLVLDLNMKDEASNRGIEIDDARLADIFGVGIVSTIAVQKKGIHSLKKTASHPTVSPFSFSYDLVIEEFISTIEPLLPQSNISKRSIALMVLSGDRTLKDWLIRNVSPEKISTMESLRDKAAEKYHTSLSYIISQQRLKAVEGIAGKVMTKSGGEKKGVTGFLGDITTHPLWGIPFLVFVIYLLYEFVGRFGAGVMVDYFEDVIFGE